MPRDMLVDSTMPTLEPGTRFGKYLLVRLLGAGKDAEVWAAIASNGARRALKIARPRTSESPKRPERAAQEADATATVEHINVVRFHDAGIEDDRVWIELELVDGMDLGRLRRAEGGRLAVDRAVRLVRQCAEGVSAAHDAGVIHRGLKPEDILVTKDDLAKVADFGRAKVRAPSVLTTSTQDPSSAFYTAPEAMRNGGAVPRSDVYSLAVVLYELLAGENPFAHGGANAMVLVKRHTYWTPPPLDSLSTVERPIPGDLSVLVQRALSKDPAQRPSMREFADRLGLVLSGLDAPRRAAARNLALPNRPFVLAKTQPVPEAPPAFERGGTIPMAAVQDRAAAPPPPPSPPPPSGPVVTQRSATFFDPPAAPPVRIAIARIEPEAPAERRSTASPVETSARASLDGPRTRRAVIGLATGTLALGLLATGGWLLLGRGSSPVAPAPPPPAPAAPAPVGSSSGATPAPTPAPSTEASASRPKATATPGKPRTGHSNPR